MTANNEDRIIDLALAIKGGAMQKKSYLSCLPDELLKIIIKITLIEEKHDKERREQQKFSITRSIFELTSTYLPSKELAEFLHLNDHETISAEAATALIIKYIKDNRLYSRKVSMGHISVDDNSYINIDKDPALLKLFPEAKDDRNLKFIDLRRIVKKHLIFTC